MLYYSNSTASFEILLRSGDIAQNPGPARCGLGKQGSGSKQRTTGNTHRAPVTLKCDNCEKTIRKNQKSVTCKVCFGQHHIKCTELNVKCIGTTWTCPKCLISLLPFHNCPSFDMLDELDVPVQDTTNLISVTIIYNIIKSCLLTHIAVKVNELHQQSANTIIIGIYK